MKRKRTFFVYILTNPKRTVLYIGMTNNLQRRLEEHESARALGKNSFTARYYCYNLIYYEVYTSAWAAIVREKELKKWSRKKKEALIATENPDWEFWNEKLKNGIFED